MQDLTNKDLQIVKESLMHYKQRIVDYKEYPDKDFKEKQLLRIERVLGKLNKG
ncbi:hypothetical protein N478_07350 [Pseudoalteromonas luteoviolacea S4060-1]|uniref:Uncharacterized protein n=1 Tax=Pseudoalteromonas luteoviolacea S4060-1 TaxID=1365257 RepID=A0A167J177_9GAMM|nr:hypothetical protein N478_07350 [Pseudoalteromonas luteoviolacea S4060-1]